MGIVRCDGWCQCCADTSGCYDLKGGIENAVKEGVEQGDDKPEYQDGDGTWEAAETGSGDKFRKGW
jgi:hypothetical protein